MSLWSKARHGLGKLAAVVSTVFGTLAGVGILLLMFLTVLDVCLREARGRGIEGAPEISEVALVAVVFLGMVAAQTSRSHISTPLLTSRFPARIGHAARTFSLLVATLFVAWLTYETAGTALTSFEAKEFRYGIISVPVWPARVVIPLGLFAMFLALTAEVLEQARKFARNAPRDVVDYDALSLD